VFLDLPLGSGNLSDKLIWSVTCVRSPFSENSPLHSMKLAPSSMELTRIGGAGISLCLKLPDVMIDDLSLWRRKEELFKSSLAASLSSTGARQISMKHLTCASSTLERAAGFIPYV
jgi:hypothetical protein